MTPNEFWSRDDKTRSWRFYVALSEFTSAVLDYATGADLLNRRAVRPITWQLDRMISDAGRLNWPATCSYYSLVHTGRMLVFLPFGDFPTGHSQLGQWFGNSEEATARGRPRQGKGWLPEFLRALQPAEVDGNITGVDVDFTKLAQFYGTLLGSRCEVHEPEGETIQWFGHVLRQAKKLREENNYEALLIAHEYDHEVVTDAFEKLARTMSELAERSLERFGVWFARYLDTSTGENWDWASEGKIWFAEPFLEHRELSAGLREW